LLRPVKGFVYSITYDNGKEFSGHEHSKIPLRKWLYGMYLVVTARKGISSYQLAKELGIFI
jgi:hypothetical protein